MTVTGLLMAAVVVEALIEAGKQLVVNRKIQWPVVASWALGILIAFVFGVDLFALAGVTAAVPYVGTVCTGIFISRGSNYLSDLLGRLNGAKGDGELEKAASVEAPDECAEG